MRRYIIVCNKESAKDRKRASAEEIKDFPASELPLFSAILRGVSGSVIAVSGNKYTIRVIVQGPEP